MGIALEACLRGLGTLFAEISRDPQGSDRARASLLRIAKSGIPNIYHAIMFNRPTLTPLLCKVDVMETVDGEYKIAEIDGHNKHGLGYAELSRQLLLLATPGSKTFEGAAAIIARAAFMKGADTVVLLYGDHERFYLPEFLILKQAVSKYDVELTVVDELSALNVPIFRNAVLLVDFPFMHRKPEVSRFLLRRYAEGLLDFIIPPKPHYGSKALIALLKNSSDDPALERLLANYLPEKHLAVLRSYLPPTVLLDNRDGTLPCAEADARPFVLKKCVSSGMKGVFFPGESGYASAVEVARCSRYQYVLQEFVEPRQYEFDYWDSDGAFGSASWFIRLTMYFSHGKIADAKVAARRDIRVHGAKDCLQIGVALPESYCNSDPISSDNAQKLEPLSP